MADDATGSGGGPPSFPGSAPPPPPAYAPPQAPPVMPSMPPPPSGPPSQFPPPGAYAQPGARTTPSGEVLASWGIRVGGFLIDGILLAVVQVILQAALHKSNTLRYHYVMTMSNGTTDRRTISFLVLLLGALVFLVYGTLMIGGRGQTIGMMAVGIRAVRAVDDGPVGMSRAFGRALVQMLLSYTVVIGILSDLWPLWDQKRQTLQDKAAGTVVIRSRPSG